MKSNQDVTAGNKLNFAPTKPGATCMDCKARGPIMRQAKNGKSYPRPFYKVFEQVNWFRGDDEYLGTVCHDCKKKQKEAV